MSTIFLTVPSKTLAASIDAATYSFQPSDILGWDGNALTSGNFGSTAYVVFRSSDNKKMELMSFDPTTIASASITILKRGLSFSPTDLVTEVAANKQIWVKNDTIIEFGSNPPQLLESLKEYIDAAAIAGSVPSTPSVLGYVKLSTAAANPASPVVVGDNDTRMPTQAQKDALAGTGTPSGSNKFVTSDYTGFNTPTGVMSPYAGYTAPTGWILCDGSAISRTGANASLFSLLCPSATFTVTLASPGVFSATAHGLKVGDKIHLTTTGALPTGLATNTDYYIISAGFTANAFEVSLSPGGPAINTSVSQSGVHTFYRSNFGKGDGSTTFAVPDLRQRIPIAIGQSSYTLLIDNSNVTLASPSVFTIPADSELYQGQAIVLTTSGTLPTGFTPGNTYYVIRASQNATTIQLASSQGNANAGTGVNGSGSQSGVHTLTYTPVSNRTIIGRVGGEETHGVAIAELAAHTHTLAWNGGGAGLGAASNTTNTTNTGSTGSDAQHNNMSPFMTVTYIIKL